MPIEKLHSLNVVLFSEAPGILLKYWAVLNSLGIYKVTPYSKLPVLLDNVVKRETQDVLLYDHQGVVSPMHETLTLLARRAIASKIIMVSDLERSESQQLLIWAWHQKIPLLKIVRPPLDCKMLSDCLGAG